MILKKIEELEGNEILARAVVTFDYQIILPEGAVLKPEYVSTLEELGIIEVYIKQEDLKTEEIVILRSEVEESVKVKVKEIISRHTYQGNKNLEELSKTADSIITNILEEEQVIEKIYDIKQRSSDIYEHSISICSLSILTALKMKVKKENVHDIGVACLLHDLGLRYITASYENKEVEEYEENDKKEYKKHPIYGYSALQDEMWISDLCKDIILSHHERIDGTGYPLKKKKLSLECRIVNVCDQFDELICGIGCKRMKVYEAIEYLKQYTGSRFDDKVVSTFLAFTAVYPAGSRVLTNEGETAVVIRQNKNFLERPVLRILKDKDGNTLEKEVIKDMVKIRTIFIEKGID
ncbi:HD domain-containing protein [Lachnospiraceae bacterium OttesenSCG-928-D06]|nr:HD domain-containing protein [Lachnospiraceae bacterium OttesenSCG-928-D06]